MIPIISAPHIFGSMGPFKQRLEPDGCGAGPVASLGW
jgi:hypothetical protein